ncbi:MAG: sensor histidine kinase [Rhizobiaceae bacterium]|nr:sensor histidine kinase [Rhizobiaceae bacterium]
MIIRDKYGVGHLSLRTALKLLLALSCWIILTLSIASPASGESLEGVAKKDVLVLDGAKTSGQLQPHIHYYLDENWERTIPEILGEYADQFKPIETQDPDFGYTNSKIWLRINLKNTSDLTENWRLYFKENFKQLFDVYIIRENFSVENVLSQDLERGFNSRPIQFPELVAPLLIEPGSEVTVLVNYWSEGASYMQLSLETVASFEEIASARTAKNFVYYGMMLLLISAALLSLLIFWHVVFAAYIAYALSTLVFLMHSDGVAYQYLWPSFPKFNSVASIFIGSALIISASNYARVFLITKKRHRIVDKVLLAVIIVTTGLFVGHLFFDNQFIKRALVFMSLVAVISCVLAAVVASIKRFKEVRFFLFAWIGVVLAALIMNLRHQFGVEISQDIQNDLIRIAMVVEAAMIGLAIADRYNQSQNARQSALQESLSTAKRNLQLNKRLNDLEGQFSAAMVAASDQSREFANTIHDLKQPIHALRLRVHSLTENSREPEENSNVEETFEYLEELVSMHLQSSQTGIVNHDPGCDQKNASDLSLNDVLESVHHMFLPDAEAKGLEFSYVPSALETDLPNLVLMRIATNLVSNAVKYTSSGKILMGCRHIDGKIGFEVHDTGPGMNAEEFEQALKRNVRLDGKDEHSGNGYGLSIVSELASTHKLGLGKCASRTTGFGIRVELCRK